MLEVIRALSREADKAEAAAEEARSILALALYHVAGGRTRTWRLTPERISEAQAGTLELGWNQRPGGELEIVLTARPGSEPEEAPR